jgi:hypothetical protein
MPRRFYQGLSIPLHEAGEDQANLVLFLCLLQGVAHFYLLLVASTLLTADVEVSGR